MSSTFRSPCGCRRCDQLLPVGSALWLARQLYKLPFLGAVVLADLGASALEDSVKYKIL